MSKWNYVAASPSALDELEQKGWTRGSTAPTLQKSLKFKSFKKAWAFMNDVAASCEELRHHPEWTNVYNRVDITLTTHYTNSLTQHDTTLAARIDDAAAVHDGQPNP